jgi:hypothetical protein
VTPKARIAPPAKGNFATDSFRAAATHSVAIPNEIAEAANV